MTCTCPNCGHAWTDSPKPAKRAVPPVADTSTMSADQLYAYCKARGPYDDLLFYLAGEWTATVDTSLQADMESLKLLIEQGKAGNLTQQKRAVFALIDRWRARDRRPASASWTVFMKSWRARIADEKARCAA